MLIDANLTTLLLVVILALMILYKVSFFHNRKIFHLSLYQLFGLVIVPGFLIPFVNSHIETVRNRPMVDQIYVTDIAIVNIIYVSIFFIYGGLCIHAVTKMLSTMLKKEGATETLKVNRFFHLTFSHNLIYLSVPLCLVALTMLELNHIPRDNAGGYLTTILMGILLGLSFIFSLFTYNPYAEDAYSSRWSDLKVALAFIWMLFVVFLYLIKRMDPGLTDYQLLIPALLSLSLFMLLSMALVVRRVKRGGWRVDIRWDRLLKLVKFRQDED